MTFDEALAAASHGDLISAKRFFASDEQPIHSLILNHTDNVEFDEECGMPMTLLRREFVLSFRGLSIASWWEEYTGYYGSGYTGWWVENVDRDGPPDGLIDLLREVGIILPQLIVPKPPTQEEELGEE